MLGREGDRRDMAAKRKLIADNKLDTDLIRRTGPSSRQRSGLRPAALVRANARRADSPSTPRRLLDEIAKDNERSIRSSSRRSRTYPPTR